MIIQKNTIEKAISVLKQTPNITSDLGDLCVALQQMLTNENNQNSYVNLIDKEAYFAKILWQAEDIRSHLREEGLPDTDETVDEVLSYISVSAMEDCSDGWLYIYDAVAKYEENHPQPPILK